MYSGTKLYTEYRSGAGPEPEQSKNNDMAMALSLTTNQIPHIWTNEWAKKMWGGDELQIKILHPQTKKPIYVSYDRFGFVIDGIEDGDQEDLVTVLDYIKKWYYGK